MSDPSAHSQSGQGSVQFGDHARVAGDVFIGDKIIQPPPVGAAARHQLPAPPLDFTGRPAELAELRAAIQAGARLVALRGQGGVGKTALALVLAHEFVPAYPDAQLYLDLRGAAEPRAPVAPAEALAHFIHAFEPTAQLPDSLPERQAIYRSLLAGKRALVLLDNARDRAQVEPLLPPPGCLALLTSRQRFVLPGLHAHDLERLPRPDAVSLLLKIAPRIGAGAAEIAALCGDLPQALRLAASALAETPDLEVDDYLARLRDETRRLTELDEVARALALSFGLVSAAAQAAWPPLAVFPGGFDRPAAIAVLGLEAEAGQAALSELVRYSLLEFDPAAKRYRLHDLARLAAGQRLSAEAREAAAPRHAAHYQLVLAAADERFLQGGPGVRLGLGLFDQERLNIEAGQAWAAAHAATDDAAARLTSAYPGAGIFVLDLRQPARQRLAWLEAALGAARRLGDRAAEGAHLGNLGLARLDLGEPRRAIECCEQSAAIARELGDREGEGAALGSLGTIYRRLGEARRAIELLEQHLAIARETGNRRGEGNALGNLGNVYADLGEPRPAVAHHERWLAIAREIGDRRAEAAALGNLGSGYLTLGEPRRAIDYYAQHLAIARELGDREGEGTALGNLGTAYGDLGELPRAIEHFQQALAIDRELGDRRGEAQDLGNLGNAYADLGELPRAIEIYEQALAVAREIADRRSEGAALGNLGLAYAEQGQPRRALEYHEHSLAIKREIGDRRGEADSLWNLSLALDALGEREAATTRAEAALRLYEQTEDPNAEQVRQTLAAWQRSGPAASP